MFCKNCGSQLNENAVVCLKCGVLAGDGNRYCRDCGSPIVDSICTCKQTSPQPEVIEPEPQPAPMPVIPKAEVVEVKEEATDSPKTIFGRGKNISTLFIVLTSIYALLVILNHITAYVGLGDYTDITLDLLSLIYIPLLFIIMVNISGIKRMAKPQDASALSCINTGIALFLVAIIIGYAQSITLSLATIHDDYSFYAEYGIINDILTILSDTLIIVSSTLSIVGYGKLKKNNMSSEELSKSFGRAQVASIIAVTVFALITLLRAIIFSGIGISDMVTFRIINTLLFSCTFISWIATTIMKALTWSKVAKVETNK